MLTTSSTIDRISRLLPHKKQQFLVFDRDGTLVPYADDPDLAVFDGQVRRMLEQLAHKAGVHVGILSARSIMQLRQDLPGNGHMLAGNYGLEIEIDESTSFYHPDAERSRPLLARASALLREKMSRHSEIILEDHGLSLCLHWHKIPPPMQKSLHKIVGDVAALLPELNFRQLNSSYEIWPDIEWDKSHGLETMLSLSALNPHNVELLFAGDSPADEPAFKWVNEHNGVSILVGSRQTEAQFTLETPASLHELIHRLVTR